MVKNTKMDITYVINNEKLISLHSINSDLAFK